MKKLWIGVLAIAFVIIVAIFVYSPDSSNANQNNQIPIANSDSGRSVENETPTENNQASTTIDNTSTGSSDESSIKLTELAIHNSKNDCWIAYKNKVYDITEFLPVHPGSSRAIEPYCGTSDEFESAFTDQHGTSKAGMLEKRGVFKGNL